MEEIDELLNSYRESARNLWNVYIRHQILRNEKEYSPWEISDEFDDLCTILFHMLVLKPLGQMNYQKTASYKATKDALPFIHVAPKHEVQILINREKNETSGYWDYPVNSLKPNMADIRFVDYFDFDKLGYRNFEYYHVRIVSSDEFPDLIERDALLIPQHVNILFQKDY
jgi:hypothetical protein